VLSWCCLGLALSAARSRRIRSAGEGFSRGGARIVSLERYGSHMSGHVIINVKRSFKRTVNKCEHW
jgi:hypothetical protein